MNVHRQPKVGVLQSLTLALILIHSPCCIMIFILHSTVCTFAYAFTFVYAPLLQIRLVPCRPKVWVPLLEQGIYAFSLYTFTECSDSCGWQWWRGEISVYSQSRGLIGLPPLTCIRTYVCTNHLQCPCVSDRPDYEPFPACHFRFTRCQSMP